MYLDPGTVCAAIALPAAHPAASAAIPELYAPLLDGMVRACRALGVDATRDERTVRVGDRKVTGIAAHRGRDVTLVHGTLLVTADLDALRACLAGSRGGDLQGRPRPAASRPDHVTLVGGDAEAAAAGGRRGVRRARCSAGDLSPARARNGRCAPARALPRSRLACRSVARCHPGRRPRGTGSVIGRAGFVGMVRWGQRRRSGANGIAIEGLHVPGGADLARRADGRGDIRKPARADRGSARGVRRGRRRPLEPRAPVPGVARGVHDALVPRALRPQRPRGRGLHLRPRPGRSGAVPTTSATRSRTSPWRCARAWPPGMRRRPAG